MAKNPETVGEVLGEVRQLLDAGKAKEALELLNRCGRESLELGNAFGVCLMRIGNVAKAVEHYRHMLIGKDGVYVRREAPAVLKTNFATALLLEMNVAGCLDVLKDVGDENDENVKKIRAVVVNWKRTLNWPQRIWLKVSGQVPNKPVMLGFAPGELWEKRQMRPAA